MEQKDRETLLRNIRSVLQGKGSHYCTLTVLDCKPNQQPELVSCSEFLSDLDEDLEVQIIYSKEQIDNENKIR